MKPVMDEGQPIPQSPVTPATPQQNEVGDKSDGGSEDKNNQAIKLEQDIRNGERWLIGIGTAGVVLSVVIALIYFGQLREMRKATRASAKAADAAVSAANIARDTLQETRNEQRPWVVVKDARIVLEPLQPAKVNVVFANFGHSPALDAEFVASLYVATGPVELPPPKPVEDELTHAVVAPGMDMNIQVHTFVTLTAEIAERMKKPDVRYYIFGEGTYKDTTTEHEIHHTHYCMYVRYGITGVTPCTSNQYKNKAD